jgi:hypothetical protein
MAIPHYDRNFKGAIGLANWIKNNHWFASNEPVNITQGGVWPSFKNAVQKERGEREILRYYVDYLTTTSICKEVDHRFQILVPKTFNPCHRRFALCKELCHILTDNAPFKSHDPIAQLTRALQTVRQVLNSPKDSELSPLFTSTDLTSEDFCFLLALEILIPINKRDKIITDVKVTGTKTAYNVACDLRIPQSLVRFFIESYYNRAFKQAGGIDVRLE